MPTFLEKKKLTDYILNNSYIDNYFNKIEPEFKDDFIQEMWVIFMEHINNNYDRMCVLYEEDKLGKYLVGIITNQLISNNSSFYRKFKKVRKIQVELKDIDIPDTEYVIDKKPITLEQILIVLNNLIYYDAVLFKLYYGICPITNQIIEKKTYKEIADLIGLKDFQTIRNNIIATKKIILSKC